MIRNRAVLRSADRLHEVMKLGDVTNRTLAERIGKHFGLICKLRAGHYHSVPTDVGEAIEDALGEDRGSLFDFYVHTGRTKHTHPLMPLFRVTPLPERAPVDGLGAFLEAVEGRARFQAPPLPPTAAVAYAEGVQATLAAVREELGL